MDVYTCESPSQSSEEGPRKGWEEVQAALGGMHPELYPCCLPKPLYGLPTPLHWPSHQVIFWARDPNDRQDVEYASSLPYWDQQKANSFLEACIGRDQWVFDAFWL